MLFANVPRVKLIPLPTPLHQLIRYGEFIGHSAVYIKRDDVMILGMGGNKVRNLEFWLGEALEKGADVVIAAGMEQSNQCRLAAAAAAKLGIECILVHNCHPPAFYQGNMLLNHLAGARLEFIGSVSEEQRAERVQALANELKARGRHPYVIGDRSLGALGYVNAAFELKEQARQQQVELKHVVIVGAMGPTAAGFVYGTACLERPFHVHVISVEYTAAKLRRLMREIIAGIERITGHPPTRDIDGVMTIYEEFLGPGYGRPTPQSLQAVYEMARLEGIFLENVYTSKTVWALKTLVERGVIGPDEAVCYIHTGGMPALFAQADLFQPRSVSNTNQGLAD